MSIKEEYIKVILLRCRNTCACSASTHNATQTCQVDSLLIGHLCLGHTRHYSGRDPSAAFAGRFGSVVVLQLFCPLCFFFSMSPVLELKHLSQDFCSGKRLLIAPKIAKRVPDNASQLPGCIRVSSCTLTENRFYRNVLHSPTLFSLCKQLRLNIICCLIKLFLARKKPRFYLTNSIFTLSCHLLGHMEC